MDWEKDLFLELKNDVVLRPPRGGVPSALDPYFDGTLLRQPVSRRKDYLTDTWCHLNLARATRPFAAPQLAPSENAFCAFCPENESATPRDTETGADTVRIGEKRWTLRAFPNLYPWLAGHGNVVESPGHKISLKDIDEEEQLLALRTIQGICRKFEENNLYPIIFKNQGWGASTAHTHWQYGALPYLPKRPAQELRAAIAFSEKWNLNVYEAIISSEKGAGERFVAEDENVSVIVPFAPRTNYEVWLIMKRPAASLTEAAEESLVSLSRMLVTLLRSLYQNLGIDSLCAVVHQVKNEPLYRLHIEILPFKHWAGAERGFEEYVVEVTPESAAASLRSFF